MSHQDEKKQDEKKQAAKANARPNEQVNKGPQKTGQPANHPQADARELDGAAQFRWSENERNERAERGERNERADHSEHNRDR
jgi:hypothetical protein